jgi:hypothetical protein
MPDGAGVKLIGDAAGGMPLWVAAQSITHTK